jgi:hypothetical protein
VPRKRARRQTDTLAGQERQASKNVPLP